MATLAIEATIETDLFTYVGSGMRVLALTGKGVGIGMFVEPALMQVEQKATNLHHINSLILHN